MLKDISATTSYVYDSYGYPTEESISYTGNITVKKTNTYSSKTTVEDGYNLGFLTKQIVTVNRGGSSYTEQMYIPVYSSRLPTVKVYSKDGNQVKQYNYVYDSYGNPTSETLMLYTSSNLQKTSYEYDSYGRLSKVTSPMGLSNTFTYNAFGQVATVKDYKGSNDPEKKAIILKKICNEYDKVVFVDDDKKNVDSAKSLNLPNLTVIKAWK